MRRLLLLIGLYLSCFSLAAAPETTSRIAAVINKNIISQAELMHRLHLAALSSGLEPTSENLKKIKDQILRIMIDEKLQLAIGETYKLNVNADQVKRAIRRIEESNGMTEGHLARVMVEHGIPLAVLEDQIKANLMWIEFIREKYNASLQISDAEIASERRLYKERETKTQYHLAEIVLPFETPEQEQQVRLDLERLVIELQKGAHFAALAQQFSQAATAAQGGDMGWLTEDQLLPEIKEFIEHMQPNMLSQPIRTPQSYIIVGYIEKKLPTPSSSAELSEDDAQNIIAEKKLGLLSTRELRDLRRHAFIDIRI